MRARPAVMGEGGERQRRQIHLEELPLRKAEEARLQPPGGQGQTVGDQVVVDLAVLRDVHPEPVAPVRRGQQIRPPVVVAQQMGHLVHPDRRELRHRRPFHEAG